MFSSLIPDGINHACWFLDRRIIIDSDVDPGLSRRV